MSCSKSTCVAACFKCEFTIPWPPLDESPLWVPNLLRSCATSGSLERCDQHPAMSARHCSRPNGDSGKLAKIDCGNSRYSPIFACVSSARANRRCCCCCRTGLFHLRRLRSAAYCMHAPQSQRLCRGSQLRPATNVLSPASCRKWFLILVRTVSDSTGVGSQNPIPSSMLASAICLQQFNLAKFLEPGRTRASSANL